MNESRVARALMGLGVTIGVAAASFGVLDLEINIPDWLIRVAMIKLGFLASAGLLAGGALLARHARQRSLTAEPVKQVGEGPAQPLAQERERVKSSVHRSEDA